MTKPIVEQWKQNAQFSRKSCAQVGTSVAQDVRQNSGGLKPQRCATEKSRTLGIRFQPGELAKIKLKAQQAGYDTNTYIRAAVLKHEFVLPYSPAITEELRMVKRQLTGIGINLNQLMHKVNTGAGHTDPVLDYIDIVREPVLEAIKIIRQSLSRRTNGAMP
jgi:hypothetical protein